MSRDKTKTEPPQTSRQRAVLSTPGMLNDRLAARSSRWYIVMLSFFSTFNSKIISSYRTALAPSPARAAAEQGSNVRFDALDLSFGPLSRD